MANVTGAGDGAREAASRVGERTSEMAGRAADTVREATRSAAQTAKEATSAAGGRLRDAAHDLRERMPDNLSDVAAAARSGIEQGYAHLRETDFETLRRETMDWVRRKPLQAMLVGVGVGILLGSLMSWRRREGEESSGYGSAVAEGGRWLAERTARS